VICSIYFALLPDLFNRIGQKRTETQRLLLGQEVPHDWRPNSRLRKLRFRASRVMPGLVPASTTFAQVKQGVDGWDFKREGGAYRFCPAMTKEKSPPYAATRRYSPVFFCR
jgi:hypothetical protein